MIEWLELLLRRVWREHDVEGALADLPEDFEWVVPGFPGTEATRGPEGTLAFFRDWIDQWEDLDVEWELEQAGHDAVFAVVEMQGRGRTSGVPVELRFGQVWSFRDGVPVRMVFYNDVEHGRRAAGLAPPSLEP